MNKRQKKKNKNKLHKKWSCLIEYCKGPKIQKNSFEEYIKLVSDGMRG